MSEFLSLMFLPFLSCLILVGIHAYLGLHVIERGVIFVDLALAQIAALGATVGFALGFGLHSNMSYVTALVFSFFGAVIFSLTRFQKPRVPHEAIIGIVYAVSASGLILVLSRAPEGGEELKSLLVGHLLFIAWPEVLKIAVIYSILGLFLWRTRKPLLLISQNPHEAAARGYNVRYWDLLFYATFGFVVTSSVEMAGVLLVFTFLVIPSVCAALIFDSIGKRLAFGWIFGLIASVIGLGASYVFDLPTGAAIVCVFGLSLLFCAPIGMWLKTKFS
jgi:zinc/manganese transport system permease protein